MRIHSSARLGSSDSGKIRRQFDQKRRSFAQSLSDMRRDRGGSSLIGQVNLLSASVWSLGSVDLSEAWSGDCNFTQSRKLDPVPGKPGQPGSGSEQEIEHGSEVQTSLSRAIASAYGSEPLLLLSPDTLHLSCPRQREGLPSACLGCVGIIIEFQ